MYLIQKLKSLEKQIVYLRWIDNAEFGKIKYVGHDFIEFEILNTESYEYTETVLIKPSLIIEVVLGGPDVNRVIATFSCNLPFSGDDR